jgi:hypothetical protein
MKSLVLRNQEVTLQEYYAATGSVRCLNSWVCRKLSGKGIVWDVGESREGGGEGYELTGDTMRRDIDSFLGGLIGRCSVAAWPWKSIFVVGNDLYCCFPRWIVVPEVRIDISLGLAYTDPFGLSVMVDG